MAILNRWRVRPALAGAPVAAVGAAPLAPAVVPCVSPDAVRRIAVFTQNHARFGTLVCHIPLISSLRRHYPAARLTVVAPFAQAEMLVGAGLGDELRLWPKGRWAQLRLVRGLRADVLISLRPTSQFLTLLVGTSGAPARLAYATGLGRVLLPFAPPRDLRIYRPLNYLRLVERLGVPPSLSGYLTERAAQVAGGLDPEQERYCFLPGGASPFKLWGIDNFLALGARLRAARPQARFVVVLGPGEQAMRGAIAASPLAAATKILDRPSLGALAQAILASRVTVANDCGPSHVAQLLDRPYVGIFANHRGQAETTVQQWFHPRPGSTWITGPAGGDIRAIPAEAVYEKVVAVAR